VLASTVYVENYAAFETFGEQRRGSLERLRVAAEPGFDDAVAADTGVDAACDGLYFRQLGHRFIVEDDRGAQG